MTHPCNTAPCGCDGHGQVHHGKGALSWVSLCRDRDCGLRRDALFMGVDPAVLDAWWPRETTPTSHIGVNGLGLRPKDGDPGAASRGDEIPAPAADPSCAEREDPSRHVDGNTDHDPARDPYPRSRAGSGRTDRKAA